MRAQPKVLMLLTMMCGCTTGQDLLTPVEIANECKNFDSSWLRVMGWDSHRQTELESVFKSNRSPIFLEIKGCEMKILTDCHEEDLPERAYKIRMQSLLKETKQIKDQKALYSTIPFTASNLKGSISSTHYLLLDYKMNAAGTLAIKSSNISCVGATHYIDRIYFGAYRIERLKRSGFNFRVSLFGGGYSEDKFKFSSERGDINACKYNQESRQLDQLDPKCSAIVGIGVKTLNQRKPKPTIEDLITEALNLIDQGQCDDGLNMLQQVRETSADKNLVYRARYHAGSIYEQGCDAAPNLERASEIYRALAEVKYQPAIKALSRLNQGLIADALNLIEQGQCANGLNLLQKVREAAVDASLAHQAEYNIAATHERGCSGAPDLKTAADMYKSLAEKHQYPAAIRALGLMYVQGQHFRLSAQNKQTGLDLLQRAARLGDSNAAQLQDKYTHERGNATPCRADQNSNQPDPKCVAILTDALNLIEQGQCADGLNLLQNVREAAVDASLVHQAEYNIAVTHERGCSGAPDLKTAADMYKWLAEKHQYPAAIRALGLMYVQGRHFRLNAQNKQTGLDLLQRAARLGDSNAAQLYDKYTRERGNATPCRADQNSNQPDPKCAAIITDALNLIEQGQCIDGLNLLQNVREAAVDASLVHQAEYNIAVTHERGCNGIPDLKRAADMYKWLAEKHQYPAAIRALGMMYVQGRHFGLSAQNKQIGLNLLLKAARLGDSNAAKLHKQFSH